MKVQHYSPHIRGIISARAEVSPVALVNEIKATFEQFKAANDERIKAIEARKSDPLHEEKVGRIEASLQELQSKLADVAAQAAFRGGAGAGNDKLAQAAADFSAIAGQSLDVDAYRGYTGALNAYMRRGESVASDVRAQMSVGSDPNGGYLVTSDMSGQIARRVYETSPMRQVASVQIIGTDALEGLNDLDEADAGWVSEMAARPDTGTPTLGKWRIPVHEIYAQPKATQMLLDDAAVDVEAWLANKVAERFARRENAAFVVGDGDGKPRGLFSYPTAVTADATRPWGTFQHFNTGSTTGFGSGATAPDVLIDTVFGVKADYRTNAAWMMSRATLATVRKLKDGDDNYLWQPNFQERAAGTLLGHSIVEAEDVPAIGSNALAIAFGDYRAAYQIVDRLGIRVLRDPFTNKPFVRFYTTKRVGGGALNFEAVKFIRFGTP